MSKLDEIFNDDLLKCEIVETAENDVERVDLIKWTHDNTFSVARVSKDTGKLEVTDIKTTSESTAIKQFYNDHWNVVIFG